MAREDIRIGSRKGRNNGGPCSFLVGRWMPARESFRSWTSNAGHLNAGDGFEEKNIEAIKKPVVSSRHETQQRARP